MTRIKQNLENKVFGRWTALEYIPIKKGFRGGWLCECICGNRKVIRTDQLVSGQSKSCGCYNNEKCKELNQFVKTHGMSGTELYKMWSRMKTRCDRKEEVSYPNYGGRGITYSEDFKTFEGFKEFALNNGWSTGLSIERKDVNKNYCVENCCFIERKLQNRNKRNTKYLTLGNKTQCQSAWSEETGIPENTLLARLKKGWSVEKALTTPVDQNKNRFKNK